MCYPLDKYLSSSKRFSLFAYPDINTTERGWEWNEVTEVYRGASTKHDSKADILLVAGTDSQTCQLFRLLKTPTLFGHVYC